MFVVAGASGRTGKVVASALLAERRVVRVLVRDGAAGEAWRARGAQVQLGSLDDEVALQRALEGAEALYALVPEDLSARELRALRRRIVDALAAAVRGSAVSHVVLLSADAAVLPEGNGPARELHYAENALRAAASRLTALRASYFQENVSSVWALAAREGIYPNFLPSADLAISMIATRDVAQRAVRALLEPPSESEIVDLVGPMYSAREAAERLGAVLGKPLHVVDIPAREHAAAFMRAGAPPEFAASLAELYACLATRRVQPAGDRMLAGTTTLEETLASSIPPR